MSFDPLQHVRDWLFARYIERQKSHNLIRRYSTDGLLEGEPRQGEKVFARVPVEEFHQFLMSVGGDLNAIISNCTERGWICYAEGGFDVKNMKRYYLIFPSIMGSISLRSGTPDRRARADTETTYPALEAAKPAEKLTRTENAVLSIIKAQPRGTGIPGKEIIRKLKAKRISIKETTLRRHILPKLATHHGVVNHRSAGGYLVP